VAASRRDRDRSPLALPPGGPPTWEALFAGEAGEAITAVEGSFFDSTGDEPTTVEVLWRGEEAWQIFDEHGSGGMQLHDHTVLIARDVEVVRLIGAALHSKSAWRDVLARDAPSYAAGVSVAAIAPVHWAGRACWQLTLEFRSQETDLVVDQEYGVILRVHAEGRGRWFSDVAFNESVVESVVDWHGEVSHGTGTGTGYVADDETGSLFSANVSHAAGPASCGQIGPSDTTARAAVDWARARADRVQVRWQGRHYSGGRRRIRDYPELSMTEVERPPHPTDQHMTDARSLTAFLRKSDAPLAQWLRDAVGLAGFQPDYCAIASLPPEEPNVWRVCTIVTSDGSVLTTKTQVVDNPTHRPAAGTLDSKLTPRWQSCSLRDEIAAAFSVLDEAAS
jgi:hypothetical protein